MSRDFPDNWPDGMPWPKSAESSIQSTLPSPSAEELNKLRRDASEGDTDAATFFRNTESADEALKRWREAQIPTD